MTIDLASLIEQRVNEWSKQLDCPIVPGQSLLETAEKAKTLEIEDAKNSLDTVLIPEKDKLPPHLRLNVEFNPFLAETLLREGSLLLDRCLQERREYDELRTKYFEACVQLQELSALNAITKQEEDTYKTSLELADLELTALQMEQTGIQEAIKVLEGESNSLLNKMAADLSLTTRGIETYLDYVTAQLADKAEASADALAWASIPRGDKKMPKYKKTPAELSSDYAGYSEVIRGLKETSALKIQLAQLKGASGSLTEKIKAAIKQRALKEQQLNFQKMRNDVARFVAVRRADELMSSDGVLNYKKQIKSTWERLQYDLIAAWLRISSAAKGFELLYDYIAFDDNSKILSRGDFNKDIYNRKFNFDDLVTWSQVTNTWLASFLDIQQNVTRSFSLSQLLREQGRDLNDGLSSGKWRFKLKEKHFSNSKLVRLRGVSIQIDSGHSEGSWNVAISPPSKAILRVNESKVKNLEQGHIGTLYLGRVNETTFQVMPESAAPPKIYNASPIGEDTLNGEWGIEILGLSTASGMSTNEKPASSINDIDIHLSVALV